MLLITGCIFHTVLLTVSHTWVSNTSPDNHACHKRHILSPQKIKPTSYASDNWCHPITSTQTVFDFILSLYCIIVHKCSKDLTAPDSKGSNKQREETDRSTVSKTRQYRHPGCYGNGHPTGCYYQAMISHCNTRKPFHNHRRPVYSKGCQHSHTAQ